MTSQPRPAASRFVRAPYRIFLAALLAAGLLAGCSRPQSVDVVEHAAQGVTVDDRDHSLAVRLRQLEETLAQMEKEFDLQKSRIQTARSEIQVLRDMTRSLDEAPVVVTRGDAPAPARVTPGEDIPSAADTEGNRFLTTVIIVIFLLFLVVYGYAMWTRRDSLPESETGGGSTVVLKPRPPAESAGAPAPDAPAPPGAEDSSSGALEAVQDEGPALPDGAAPPADDSPSDKPPRGRKPGAGGQ